MTEGDRARWDRRWSEEEAPPREPDPFLVGLDPVLPGAGRALDLAAGRGRHAVWLAGRGLEVTAVDVSPVGLRLAREHAARQGVALRTEVRDLEATAAPEGPWDVIVCVGFLHRPLYRSLPERLAPGGWLVVVQATRSNLERHEHPSARFLLDDGELPGLFPGLHVERYEEGWTEAGRHHARLAARRA